jgi:DNA-binding CsgD family transcriptional regulator
MYTNPGAPRVLDPRAELALDISALVATVDRPYDVLLDLAATIVSGVIGDICVISLLSDDRRTLHPLGLHHRDPEIQRSLNIGEQMAWASSGGVSEQVLATGAPAIFSSADHRRADLGGIWAKAFDDDAGVETAAIVAMRASGRRIGLVAIAARDGTPICDEDVPCIQEIADRLALVVENGHLREEVERLHNPARAELPDPRLRELTTRELEILGLIGSGLTNRDIGERLFLSVRTVEWHRARLSAKTGASKRSELSALARTRLR